MLEVASLYDVTVVSRSRSNATLHTTTTLSFFLFSCYTQKFASSTSRLIHFQCLSSFKQKSNQVQNCLPLVLTTVLSGDTIVLIGKPRPDGKPPNERILSLAYVSAPRMKRDGDEVSPSDESAYFSHMHLRPGNTCVSFLLEKISNFPFLIQFLP